MAVQHCATDVLRPKPCAFGAGAAVSGAIVGNKTAKISDTVNLTVATVGGVTIAEHTRTVIRTAIPTLLISALIFLLLGLTGSGSAAAVDPVQVQDAIAQHFMINLLAFIPIILIFVLFALRFSAYMSLMLPAIVAVVLAAFTQHNLTVSLAADPDLNYLEAFLRVGDVGEGCGGLANCGLPRTRSRAEKGQNVLPHVPGSPSQSEKTKARSSDHEP